jgi:tetratricopeptide (TPR) repeat protein
MTQDLDPIRDAVTPEDCSAALDALLRSNPEPGRRLVALYDAALTYWRLGALDRAEDVLKRVLEDGGDLVPADGGPTLRESSQVALAAVVLDAGRGAEAVAMYADVARSLLNRDSALEAMQLTAQALPRLKTIGPKAIAPLLEVAADAAERATPSHDLLDALTAVGYEAYLCGELGGAIAFQERALRLATRSRDQEAVAQLLENVVTFAFQAHDLRRVVLYGRRATDSARGTGSPNRAALLTYAAIASTELGRSDDALGLLDELEATGDLKPAAMTAIHGLRAQVLLDLKRFDAAAEVLARVRGVREPAIESLHRRFTSETSGPLTLDCAHRVLAMARGQASADVSHEHPVPWEAIEPEAYRAPGLDDADRVRFDGLVEAFEPRFMQVQWSERGLDQPAAFTLTMKLEYTPDVVAFEQNWRLYHHERDVHAIRQSLRDEWDDLRQRLPDMPGGRIDDLLEYLETVRTLCSIARELARAGERDAFWPVAFYAADLLEARTSDPSAAAVAWTERARLLDAARIVTSSGLSLLPVELQRSLEQVSAVLTSLDPDARLAVAEVTVGDWVEMAAEEGGVVDPAAIADMAAPFADALGSDTRLQVGVACSLAGRHSEALDLIESTLDAARASASDTPISYPESVGTALATSRFLTRCHSEASCVATYGVFAEPLHAEVAGWIDDVFEFPDAQDIVPTHTVPPLAFADGRLVVIATDLAGSPYVPTLLHEADHLLRRSGQMLRTANGPWLLVERDVPVASAITYRYLLDAPSLSSDNVPGIDGIRALAAVGEAAALRDTSAAGQHITNMLKHFDALGHQETPASYPCAALLAGMSRAFAGDSGAEGAHAYLAHLAVTDHVEALAFGRKRASLQW